MVQKAKNKFSIYILFIIWPFMAFLYSARHIINKNYHIIILMFSFVYGYSVFVYNGDIVSYGESFEEVCKYDWSDYSYLMTNTYSQDRLTNFTVNTVNTQADFYALSLQFFVSRVTDNPRWFWAIASLVFTFFFLQFINECMSLDEVEGKKTFIQKVFLVALILTIPFYVGVTGIRFWTALFLFCTYALKFIKKNDWKAFVIAFCSVFIHYTFIVPLCLLLINKFLLRSKLLSYALVIVSVLFFLISSTTSSLNFVRDLSSNFNETRLESLSDNYTNVDLYADTSEAIDSTNWYVKVEIVGFLYLLIGVFFLEYLGIIKLHRSKFIEDIEPFYVLIFCLSLLTYNLGSIGRFVNVFYLVSLLRLYLLSRLNPRNEFLKWIAYLAVPITIIHFLLSMRSGFYFVDPLLLIANPVVLFFVQSDVCLSELIVGH